LQKPSFLLEVFFFISYYYIKSVKRVQKTFKNVLKARFLCVHSDFFVKIFGWYIKRALPLQRKKKNRVKKLFLVFILLTF